MADAALREAERALASSPSDPETYARWVVEHLRAGGRDPRRDPRAGDVVEATDGHIRTVVGSWPMALRIRIEAWGNRAELERALGRSLDPGTGGIALERASPDTAPRPREVSRVTLPEGTLVCWGVSRELDRGERVLRSHYSALIGREWVRVDGYYDVLPHLIQAPAAVRAQQTVYVLGEWSTAGVRDIGCAYPPARAIERSSWRQWAKNGAVLRVAR